MLLIRDILNVVYDFYVLICISVKELVILSF